MRTREEIEQAKMNAMNVAHFAYEEVGLGRLILETLLDIRDPLAAKESKKENGT